MLIGEIYGFCPSKFGLPMYPISQLVGELPFDRPDILVFAVACVPRGSAGDPLVAAQSLWSWSPTKVKLTPRPIK
jgi:hypothetical protein